MESTSIGTLRSVCKESIIRPAVPGAAPLSSILEGVCFVDGALENPFSGRQSGAQGLEGCPAPEVVSREVLARITERQHRVIVVRGVPRPVVAGFADALVDGLREEMEVLALDMAGTAPQSVHAYSLSLTRGQEILGRISRAAASCAELLVLIRDADLLANLHLQHLIRLAQRQQRAGSSLILVLMGDARLAQGLDAGGQGAGLSPWIFDAALRYVGAVRGFVAECLRTAGVGSPVFTDDAIEALVEWCGCNAESIRALCGWAYLLSLRDAVDRVDTRLIHEAAGLCGLSGPDDRPRCVSFPVGEAALAFLHRQHRGREERAGTDDRTSAFAWRLRQGRARAEDPEGPPAQPSEVAAAAMDGASRSAVQGRMSGGADAGTPVPRAPGSGSELADPDPMAVVADASCAVATPGAREPAQGPVGEGGAPRHPPRPAEGGREIRVGPLRLRVRFHHLTVGMAALMLGVWLSAVFLGGGTTRGQVGVNPGDEAASSGSGPDRTGPGPIQGVAGPGSGGPAADPGAPGPAVGALMALAEGQLRASKLTTPSGDNALESYLAVLRLRPGHGPALEGLDRIRKQYQAWARAATERKDETRANRYLHKALTVGGIYERHLGTGDHVITWAGCGVTKKAFMKELAAAFERRTGIRVVLEGGGATRGIRDTANSVVQMGGSCRMALPLVDPDELHVTLHPVAWDALTVIVNPANPIEDISSEQIRQVYRGEIRNWRELGGPDAPIHLCVRHGRISGVGYAIRQYLFRDSSVDFVTDADYVFPSSGPLEEAVERDPLAIGITGVSSARKRRVGIVAVDGDRPSFENMVAGRYRFYRPLYLVTRDRPTGNVKALIDFALSPEGQDVIRANGTVPYLDAPGLAAKVLVHGFGVN